MTVDLMKRHGITPKTVFDIGIAKGTPDLYAAFPNAEYHLFDPTQESLPHMQAIAQRFNATIHNVALGDHEGETTINIRQEIGASSLFDEIGIPPDPVVSRYQVKVQRFDQVIADFARPALAKIDVQGAEVAVLKGMGNKIASLDAIVIETSTIAALQGGPEFRDVFHVLDACEFVVYDLVRFARRPLDQALAQWDLVFVPKDSPLRADKRWAG